MATPDLLDTRTEEQKMLAGDAYDALLNPELCERRLKARQLMWKFNNTPPPDYTPQMVPADYFGPDSKFQALAELFEISFEDARKLSIESPFRCDYGRNIKFLGEFYSNFNLTILDSARVTIGHRVLCAPNVSIFAATHSTDVAERQAGLERAYPVTIGDDVWIGGNVSIIGPCTIGNGVTIAAGAVVRGDIPSNVVIGGVPAKILKVLTPTASA